MRAPEPRVSVIIRAKNEEKAIGRTLELLDAQTLPSGDQEWIVVDSGSIDQTVSIARAHGAHVVEIPAESFTFGGSLNHGCREASASVIVALSAHAFPTDSRWLERMIQALADPRVACASGSDRGPDGEQLMGPVEQDASLADQFPEWGYSSAAGVFRAELWRERPFRTDMPGTEDKEWAWHWLQCGCVVLIAPDLEVAHDHSKDSLRDQYERARREWIGFGRFIDVPRPSLQATLAEWWTQRDTYRSSARARLSHRRAAQLAGKHAGRRIASRMDPGRLRLAVMVDTYPVLSETFVATEAAELARAGHHVHVEAIARGQGPEGSVPARFMTGESLLRKVADVALLVLRHPRECARDLRARRRWAHDEEVRPLRALAARARRAEKDGTDHLHVHFAGEAALEAMRISRVTGIPYSITAHAFDIFQAPTNLAEKLDSAAFVTTGCEYNADHLKGVVRDPARIHVVIMGVDVERFRRTTPDREDRVVLAVGRLVEKKGFAVLIDALAELGEDSPVQRALIVGEGPLGQDLRERALSRGVHNVEFLGSRTTEQIKALLDGADLLAMPCVVAADGDRDSMPVVCKEALAMEVPVVASREVGLPELIRPEWGRLTPPGEPQPLAEALDELLRLSPEERKEMGRAGRDWIERRCNARIEAAKLVSLVKTQMVASEEGSS